MSVDLGLAYRTLVDLEATPGEVEWAGENATPVELAAAGVELTRRFARARLERVRILARQQAFVERYGRPPE